MRLAWLAVLLLVPLGVGQDGGAGPGGVAVRDPALAPVQTVVDAVPGMVQDAYREGALDGTADQAARTVARMVAFVTGLDAQHDFPAASAASRVDLQHALEYAASLARALQSLPADAGDLYDLHAQCDHAQGVTRSQGEQWSRQERAVIVRLGAWEALLRNFAQTAPPGIDAAPLRQAADHIGAIAQGDAVRALDCFVLLEEALGIVPGPLLSLRLVPGTTWPTGSVQAIGAASGNAGHGPVRISVPTLGLVHAVASPFAVSLGVPIDAALGPHNVTATLDGLAAHAVLEVERAPASLRVDAPAQVMAGSSFSLSVRVHTPVPGGVGAGPVTLSGAVEGALPLDAAAARTRLDAAGPGTMVVRLAYPGSAIVSQANATVAVEVVPPAAPDAAQRNVGPADAPQPPGLGWLDDVATWLWVLLALLVVGVAWASMRARRAARPAQVASWTVPPPPALPGRGLVASVAAFMAWLRHLGRAGPGTTVREAAAATPGWHDLVQPFEEVRYGTAADRDHDAEAPGRLRRLLARLRRTS